MFWHHRVRYAASAVLAGTAALAILDFIARPTEQRVGASLYLAVALLLGAGLAGSIEWNKIHSIWRIVPAIGAIAATLAATFLTDAAGTGHALVGYSILALLVQTYIGFTMPPGAALTYSPLIILTLFVGYSLAPLQLPITVPFLAAPLASLLGELISALTDRSQQTQDLFASRSTRLARLEDVLHRFRRPSSMEEAAEEVAVAAVEIFEVERATVVLRDTTGGLIPVTLGPSTSDRPNPRTADLLSETLGGREPKLIHDDSESILILPLPSTDLPAGAVVLHPIDSHDPDFTIEIARLFGTQVSIAIEHLFEIDKLERATTRDELTGIGNRRHADALLASLEEGDALILLDLDGFKAVNDTLGHAAGDQVLQDLSQHLRRCLRDSDTSARLGGDEFLVVARRAFADPVAVAQRILKGWAATERSTTLSAGVALHQAGVSVDETFDRSDQALYRAKATGKNRAQMWVQPTIQASNGAGPPAGS